MTAEEEGLVLFTALYVVAGVAFATVDLTAALLELLEATTAVYAALATVLLEVVTGLWLVFDLRACVFTVFNAFVTFGAETAAGFDGCTVAFEAAVMAFETLETAAGALPLLFAGLVPAAAVVLALVEFFGEST